MSHPTGNANVREAAMALQEADLLAEYWTCLAPEARAWWVRALPAGVRHQVLRRAVPPALQSRTRTRPWREMSRFLAERAGCSLLTRHEHGVFSIDAVYRDLDLRVSRQIEAATPPGLQGAYAYEDGALETFRACQKKGWQRFYDLPIGYWKVWRELREEEAQLQPAWAPTLQGAQDSPAKLARKDEELDLANVVLVASSFTRQTLAKTKAADRVQVIPYGAPVISQGDLYHDESKPLRVLFVGALSQRKGLSYLVKAMALVGGRAELTLVGTRSRGHCPPLDQALRDHAWIPSLSHQEVLRAMRAHDVLVFPSLFEGFGLVILEAMSQGLPVITTPHTAGPDLIADGQDGFVVEIRAAEQIAERLTWLIEDRERLLAMKHAARIKAESLRWSTYRKSLATVITATLPKDSGPAHA